MIDQLNDANAATPPEGEETSRKVGGTLLPRVQELLTRIFDGTERERFESFFTSAAGAIEALGAWDFTHAEQSEEWDDARNTINLLPEEIPEGLEAVHSFLSFVTEAFPVDASADDDEFDFDLGPSDTAESSEGQEAESSIATTLNAFILNLRHELRVVRDALSIPTPKEERWSVFERLSEFRGRARSGIGEMFFLAAREHAVVRREDVVPFYKEDVNTSLALRQATTHLRARLDVYCSRLQRSLDRDDKAGVKGAIRGLHDTFDAFMKSDPYRSLRAVDRRSCIDLRQSLADLVQRDEPGRRQCETAAEGLSKFLDSLNLVSQRELLVGHDREAIADTEPHLAAMEEAVADDALDEAREALSRAIRVASPLYGREPTFDVLLNLLRHVDPQSLGPDDLLALARLLRRQL